MVSGDDRGNRKGGVENKDGADGATERVVGCRCREPVRRRQAIPWKSCGVLEHECGDGRKRHIADRSGHAGLGGRDVGSGQEAAMMRSISKCRRSGGECTRRRCYGPMGRFHRESKRSEGERVPKADELRKCEFRYVWGAARSGIGSGGEISQSESAGGSAECATVPVCPGRVVTGARGIRDRCTTASVCPMGVVMGPRRDVKAKCMTVRVGPARVDTSARVWQQARARDTAVPACPAQYRAEARA